MIDRVGVHRVDEAELVGADIGAFVALIFLWERAARFELMPARFFPGPVAVLQALGGKVPNNVFNPEVIERWKERFGDRSVLTVNEPPPDHPGYGPPNP